MKFKGFSIFAWIGAIISIGMIIIGLLAVLVNICEWNVLYIAIWTAVTVFGLFLLSLRPVYKVIAYINKNINNF